MSSDIRNNILKSTRKLLVEKGFKNVTVTDIRTGAEVSREKFYEHFTRKEDILLHYYDQAIDATVDNLSGIEGFQSETLREQLFILFQTLLEIQAEDREFAKIAIKAVLLKPFAQFDGFKNLRNRFLGLIKDLVTASVVVDEVGNSTLSTGIYKLFWEFFISLEIYWSRDESENFEKTRKMLDQSLNTICRTLTSDVIGKTSDFMNFVVKRHLLPKFELGSFFRPFRKT